MKKEYDFFISYKREDVLNVRHLVDALIGSGAHVWFAEYEILINNYKNFEYEIDRGIDTSRAAIIFTNDRWVESPHCRKEYERIARVIDPEKIIDVQIPPEQKPYIHFPNLHKSPSVIWSDNPEETIRFISEKTGVALDASWMQRRKPHPRSNRNSLRYGVSLDAGPLTMIPPPAATIAWNQAHGVMVGETYYFRGTIDGCTLQAMIHISPFIRIIGNLRMQAVDTQDDREIYRAFQIPAAEWLKQTGYKQTGLHVIPWRDHDHLGISYLENGRILHRRYSLSLQDPDSKDIGEVDLDVSVSGETDASGPVSSASFYKIALLIDRMAVSIRHDPKRLHSEEFSFISWAMVIWGVLAINASVSWFTSVIPSLISALVAGVFVGQFLSLSFSRNAWVGPLKASMLFGPKTRFYLPLFPLFRRAWDISIGLWIFSFSLILSELFVMIISLAAAIVFRLDSTWYWLAVGALAGILGLREFGKDEKPESKED